MKFAIVAVKCAMIRFFGGIVLCVAAGVWCQAGRTLRCDQVLISSLFFVMK